MKRILAFTLCLGLAMAVTAQAKPKDKEEKKARRAAAKIERKQDRAFRQGVRSQRQVEKRRPAVVQSRINARVDRPRVRIEQREGVRRNENFSRRRRGPSNHSWSFSEARRNHRRHQGRDRAWWRNNYNRFAIFAGGYYYWDRGYWYPAYGYDSSYNNYIYDEPIYGYNSLEPRQVLVNVQVELQRRGYYRGGIDGLIGPMTRSALARYQRDHGLYVTRSIDGPTLAALGLV